MTVEKAIRLTPGLCRIVIRGGEEVPRALVVKGSTALALRPRSLVGMMASWRRDRQAHRADPDGSISRAVLSAMRPKPPAVPAVPAPDPVALLAELVARKASTDEVILGALEALRHPAPVHVTLTMPDETTVTDIVQRDSSGRLLRSISRRLRGPSEDGIPVPQTTEASA